MKNLIIIFVFMFTILFTIAGQSLKFGEVLYGKDFYNLNEGFSIKYNVEQSVSFNKAEYILVVQSVTSNGNVITVNSIGTKETGTLITPGIKDSNGKKIFNSYGATSTEIGFIFSSFSIPVSFKDNDKWVGDCLYGGIGNFSVKYIGNKIINNKQFKDCIKINVQVKKKENNKIFCNGIIIVAKGIGIISMEYIYLDGRKVKVNYIEDNILQKIKIKGIVKSNNNQLSNFNVLINLHSHEEFSKIDSDGNFEISFYGSDITLYFKDNVNDSKSKFTIYKLTNAQDNKIYEMEVNLESTFNENKSNSFFQKYPKIYHIVSRDLSNSFMLTFGSQLNPKNVSGIGILGVDDKTREILNKTFTIISYTKNDQNEGKIFDLLKNYFDMSRTEFDKQITQTSSIIYYKERQGKEPILLLAALNEENMNEVYLSLKDKTSINNGIYILNHKVKTKVIENVTNNNSYPRVIKTYPSNFATSIKEGKIKVSVTFDRKMDDGYSFIRFDGWDFPEILTKPAWNDNKTICSIEFNIEKNKTYVIGLNGENFRNFKSNNISAAPYILSFTSKKDFNEYPYVVSTDPDNFNDNVKSGEIVVKIKFSKPMDGGHSMGYPQGFYGINVNYGKPKWNANKTELSFLTKLEGNKNLLLFMNTGENTNFKSQNIPMIPFVLNITTKN